MRVRINGISSGCACLIFLNACTAQSEQPEVLNKILPEMAKVIHEAASIVLPYSFTPKQSQTKIHRYYVEKQRRFSIDFATSYTPNSFPSFENARIKILKKIANECKNITANFKGECILGRIKSNYQFTGRRGFTARGTLQMSANYYLTQNTANQGSNND